MRIFSKFIHIERFENYFNKLDKYKDKSISFFNDYIPTQEELSLSKVNIFNILEPNEFFGIHNYVEYNSNSFNIILTWSDKLLSSCPNAVLFPFGEAWVDLNYASQFNDVPRSFEVTFLCGVKNLIEGHQLRQRIYQLEDKINIPHKWWYVLDDFNKETNERPGYFPVNGSFVSPNGVDVAGEGKKQIWDRKSMFHVPVENSKHNNFFTDRLIDCFLTKTIPVYWGCPNIENFYDHKGIISFNNENDLLEIINNLTPEDYTSRLEAINNNYQLALENASYFKRIEHFLDELIKLNNL